jgi:hypothetical protein
MSAAPVQSATQTFQASGEYQPVPKNMTTVQIGAAGGPASGNGGGGVTELQANEGYIEPSGRGWFNVHFRGEVEKVRGAALASQTLDKFREKAGMAPLSETKEPAAGEAAAPNGDDAPWDEANTPSPHAGTIIENIDSAQSEADFAHTGGETDELPDEDAPSVPYVPGGEVGAEVAAL